MDLRDVVKAVNAGTEIKGLFHGTTFVWPDPWTDIWDEGVSVFWDTAWHDAWSL